jgi:hypothetical protein
MKEIIVALGEIVVVIITLLFITFLLSWPVMTLWNECLMPAVEGIREIGWIQAWGISALCGILFKANITQK